MPFVPFNELEREVVRAWSDVAFQPAFLKCLLSSEVLTLPYEGPRVPAEGELFIQQLEVDGIVFVPLFSSVERIYTVFPRDTPHISLPGRIFFEISKDNTVILNPGSDLWRGFSPQEMKEILKVYPAE